MVHDPPKETTWIRLGSVLIQRCWTIMHWRLAVKQPQGVRFDNGQITVSSLRCLRVAACPDWFRDTPQSTRSLRDHKDVGESRFSWSALCRLMCSCVSL